MNAALPGAVALPLTRLKCDPSLWPREKLVKTRIRELASLYLHNGWDTIDPVVVAPPDDQHDHLVIDGWHRIEAALSVGLTQLQAIVRAVESRAEIYELAVRLSSRGPQRITREEKRAAVDRLLGANPNRPDLAIAGIAGVSHPFVAKRRRLLHAIPEERKGGPKAHRPDRCASALLRWAHVLHDVGEREDSDLPALFLARAAAKCHSREAKARLERIEAWARDAQARLEALASEGG